MIAIAASPCQGHAPADGMMAPMRLPAALSLRLVAARVGRLLRDRSGIRDPGG